MKNSLAVLLVLALASTLSAACVNLSDNTTYSSVIINNSGVLEVNDSGVLCGDTYHLSSSGFANPALLFNKDNVSLDCNGSVFDGIGGTGYGIKAASAENVTIANCSAANYSIGFEIAWVNNSFILDNNAYNNSIDGFDLKSLNNNTIANNTAYRNTFYGFIFDIATLGDVDMYNVLVDNVAYNNSDIAFYLRNTAMYNNLTNCFSYNQSVYFVQDDIGAASNNLTNFTIGYNETAGLISFGFMNVSAFSLVQYPLGSYLYLQPDFVSLDETNLPEADVASRIALETGNCSLGVMSAPSFYTTKAEILSAGSHYAATGFSCSGGVASFDVLGFSSYTLGEEETELTITMQPSSTLVSGAESNVTCTATNTEVNLTLYRNGVEVNSSFGSVQDMTILPLGSYFYECNATGNGNYSNATASGTLNIVVCTNISSSMEYTMTADATGYRTYGFGTYACMYIDSSDVTLNCDGHSITGNRSAPGNDYGIYVPAFLTNVSIINCTVSNYTEGMYVNSAYGTIIDNEMFNNTEAGLYMGSGGGNNISQNILHNNSAYGISTGAADRIYNNTIYDSPAGIGLFLSGADYLVAFNNTIFGNYYGVYFNSATYCNLTENDITNNTLYGVYMSELAVTAGYNRIIDNVIANNSLQIAIDKSYANTIYNNIVNASGAQGVISSNTYEYWNISKTLGTNIISGAYKGGNFYSNYTGVDTDGDGIGNTPYVVNQYSASTPQNAYSFEQASTGTWTTFANTYDQDWDTSGNAASGAVGYYNFTLPAGASAASGSITIKAGNAGPVPTEALIGTDWGPDCLSTEPLQVRVVGQVNKGVVKADVWCYDYTLVDWTDLGYMGTGDAAGVDVYELNATFNVVSSEDSTDYLPLTNNLNYAPTVDIMSIDGQANNTEISSLTPIIVFNTADPDNSTLNCTIYVNGTFAGGTNQSVLNGTLTSMTLNFSLTAGQAYNFTVNCSDDASTVESTTWVEAVANPTTTTTQSGNPSSDVPLSIIAEDEVPTGTLLQITVEQEGHVTLPNAHVVITFGTDTVFTGYTDAWGMVSFTPTNAGLYTIRASKLGYVAANDSFTAVAPKECTYDDNCAEDERCTQGACEKVPEGNCGIYSNHAWEDYACCASSDCGTGYSCTNHECVQRPEQPGCTLDSECQQGYVCASGACILPPPVPPECVEDGDCQAGFRCANSTCIEVPTTPGGNVTGSTGEAPPPRTQGGLAGAILNLWWLWLILLLLIIWYIYRKGKETKA